MAFEVGRNDAHENQQADLSWRQLPLDHRPIWCIGLLKETGDSGQTVWDISDFIL